MRKLIIGVVGLLLTVPCGAANLVADGEILGTTVPAEYCLAADCTGVTLENFEETLTWNRCLKLTITKNQRTKTGKERTSICLYVGGGGREKAYPVSGGKRYRLSFEAKGTVPYAVVKVRRFHADGRVDEERTSLGSIAISGEWTQYKGGFVVPEDVTAVSLAIWMFADYEKYPGEFPGADYPYPEGSALFLDKFSVEPSLSVLEGLLGEHFAVAQVPVCVDPTIPFLPDELAHPSTNLSFRAAENECGELPIAIANLTDQTEEFRVQVTRGFESVDWMSSGKLMPGFRSESGDVIGPERITVRRGVRMRDSDATDRGARYDILAKVDSVSAIPVPSKEAGLVWIEVRTEDLKPGVYRGRLQVTALVGGAAENSKRPIDNQTIDGVEKCPVVRGDDTKVIPIEFEILPFAIERSDFGFNGFAAPHTEGEIGYLNDLGGVYALVSPWGFRFTCDTNGVITARQLRPKIRKDIERIRDRARRVGKMPRILVGYSWYNVFRKVQAKENGLEFQSEAYWRAYREYTRFLADTMKELGLGFDDWAVEVIDEPIFGMQHDEAVKAYRLAKESVQEMRLLVTEGEKEFFEDLFPYVDTWIFRFAHFEDERIAGYAKRMREAGKNVSVYACYTSPRQDPSRYYRQLSWKTAAWGGSFVSLYQFIDNPYDASFHRATYGGVTYWTDEGLIPSIRLKSLLAGMTDIRYLRMLERLAAGSGDAALMRETQEFVAKSIDEVTRTQQNDAARPDGFRHECVRFIERITRHGASTH